MPTSQYLAHTPEERQTIIHPPGLYLEYIYPNSRPIPPPPGAPPPPRPINIETGKPVKVVDIANSGPAASLSEISEGGKGAEGNKKCPQCHHASNPAQVEDGTWICSGCHQSHRFVLANACEKN